MKRTALTTSAVAAVLLVTARPSLVAQNASHWVGTWSTSGVARPQVPTAPAPAPPPFMVNQCPVLAPAAPPVAPAPGQTFTPQPFVHFTNQTLRQIVHTTVGGSKALSVPPPGRTLPSSFMVSILTRSWMAMPRGGEIDV